MASTEAMAQLWLRRFHPAADAPGTLVCFPHAGGSASFYFPVSRALAGTFDVIAIQYPGRQDRRSEPPLDTIDGLADRIAPLLRSLTVRPLTLFGHSMGATVAFEVARRLESVGTGPAALFASGRHAPSRHRNEAVHLRTDDGVLAEVRSLNGTESTLLDDDDLVRMILPAIRADYRAIETYRYSPGPPLRCPITVFVGDADPKVTVDEVLAWREHTTAAFTHRVFPGGHFYLIPHAAEVIRELATFAAR